MKAIIDEQLEEVLSKLGVWEDLYNHKLHCSHCDKVMDSDNIGMFIPRRNENGERFIEFFCNAPDCINSVINTK